MQKGKELNDFQRIPLDIEILSNLRFGSLEIRDTSVTRVTNNIPHYRTATNCIRYSNVGVERVGPQGK